MVKNNHFPEIKVKIEEASDTYAKITAQPFERGYGVTIGNSLRRVLMTAVPGVAITSVRFEGVSHEFSTIKGIVEDIPDIILNLKQVRFKLVEDIGPEVVSLKLKGPGAFTGADIDALSSSFEVLNNNIHIATLMDKARVSLELRISRGKGYSSSDRNKLKDVPIGTIAMDSIFSPITNVSWDVQPIATSVDSHEKLMMEITSDGSTSPKDAVNYASSILRKHMAYFLFDNSMAIKAVNEEEISEAIEIRFLLLKSIDEMELSVRSYNCLQAAGITTIGELVQREESEMLRFKNFGRKSLNELVEKLVAMGLHFGMDIKQYMNEAE